MHKPPLDRIPPWVVSLDDYEKLAQERVEDSAWAYLSGGAADEISLRENQLAYRRTSLAPRVLQDLSSAHTGLELLGQAYQHPILVAPTAFHRLFHPEGERASMLGASAMHAGFCVSISATIPLEELASLATVRPWFQLYLHPDREFMKQLLQRIEKAGFSALVLTVDAPLHGARHRERRANFCLPDGISAVNLQGMKTLPPEEGVFGTQLLKHAPTWNDLSWLREHSRLPILLKGVIHPDDARRALSEQVDGLIVSNHGGRTLDTVPATLDVLPSIIRATNHQLPILVDGGIRRGTDILKALALGARAVMIGRPILHGLATAGAPGVAHVIKILRSELEIAMALTGCATLSEINESVLWSSPLKG